jgi:hypothetical protein
MTPKIAEEMGKVEKDLPGNFNPKLSSLNSKH